MTALHGICFFVCFFIQVVQVDCGRIHLYTFSLLFTFSCRIWFDDISVWYSYICSFLIHSVELCGSSLEDCHLHGHSGNSVLWNLFCWRHHMMWCYLLLNVLAIFMVEEFYIYAVVHFFQSLMYESNTKVAGQKVREYQRQCSISIRCLVGVKILNSMLKIKTLVRSLLLSLYLICIRLKQ